LVFIGLLKVITRRPRPKLNKTHDMALGTNTGPDKYSFPSGHSSRAILMANLITSLVLSDVYSKYFNEYTKIIFVIFFNLFSYMTCLSRLFLVRHHFTDVLAGILVGYFTYFICYISVL
jgi:membrane-associated phospholipid phosphatase